MIRRYLLTAGKGLLKAARKWSLIVDPNAPSAASRTGDRLRLVLGGKVLDLRLENTGAGGNDSEEPTQPMVRRGMNLRNLLTRGLDWYRRQPRVYPMGQEPTPQPGERRLYFNGRVIVSRTEGGECPREVTLGSSILNR